jgi:hypothetical protein
MIRQERIFATEEGGSYPGDETAMAEYRGRDAEAAILRRLSGRAGPQNLAVRIAGFFGDTLRLHESPALSSSLYEISYCQNPVGLRRALVKLQLGTGRTAESLSHELLHLGLAMDGYPRPESIFVPRRLALYAVHLISMQSIVNNLLEHEVIFDAFCRLGFDETKFLTDLPVPPNYEEIVAISLPSSTRAEMLEFSWWCLEFFRHWLSSRHGLGSAASAHADSALYWGMKVYPPLEEAVRQIVATVESGMLRNNGVYATCVNRVLQIMRLPGYSEWVIIKAGSEGEPCVLRVEQCRQTLGPRASRLCHEAAAQQRDRKEPFEKHWTSRTRIAASDWQSLTTAKLRGE